MIFYYLIVCDNMFAERWTKSNLVKSLPDQRSVNFRIIERTTFFHGRFNSCIIPLSLLSIHFTLIFLHTFHIHRTSVMLLRCKQWINCARVLWLKQRPPQWQRQALRLYCGYSMFNVIAVDSSIVLSSPIACCATRYMKTEWFFVVRNKLFLHGFHFISFNR